SDMVAQRGAGVGARAMERPKTEAKPKQEPRQEPKQKRKLSFNEKHALENLPAEMERLRGIRDKAQAILADPDLFTREPKKFEQASATLAKIDADLAAAEDRWLELEMLREELEG
ncbi:MAG: ABC transporter ATP-binding protein, partial [Rhodoblastus sp.]|nr:ABC transporter ATP-binding protein [Rhodoblastus sp.]